MSDLVISALQMSCPEDRPSLIEIVFLEETATRRATFKQEAVTMSPSNQGEETEVEEPRQAGEDA